MTFVGEKREEPSLTSPLVRLGRRKSFPQESVEEHRETHKKHWAEVGLIFMCIFYHFRLFIKAEDVCS